MTWVKEISISSSPKFKSYALHSFLTDLQHHGKVISKTCHLNSSLFLLPKLHAKDKFKIHIHIHCQTFTSHLQSRILNKAQYLAESNFTTKEWLCGKHIYN